MTGEKGSAFFKQSFELKIKGDLIPEAAAEIIGELQALFARHNAGAALSAKAVFNGSSLIKISVPSYPERGPISKKYLFPCRTTNGDSVFTRYTQRTRSLKNRMP